MCGLNADISCWHPKIYSINPSKKGALFSLPVLSLYYNGHGAWILQMFQYFHYDPGCSFEMKLLIIPVFWALVHLTQWPQSMRIRYLWVEIQMEAVLHVLKDIQSVKPGLDILWNPCPPKHKCSMHQIMQRLQSIHLPYWVALLITR